MFPKRKYKCLIGNLKTRKKLCLIRTFTTSMSSMSQKDKLFHFTSDNCTGAHSKIMQEILRYNEGECYDASYGEDGETRKLRRRIRELVNDDDVEIMLVGTGTAANVIGLGLFVRSYESILCSEVSHLGLYECGAVERNIGCRLISVKSDRLGKIHLDEIKKVYEEQIVNPDANIPKVISLTQSNEYGACYSIEELAQIYEFAREKEMNVHIDGARLSNGLVSLGCGVDKIMKYCDFMTFGFTKNGILHGELIVFRPENSLNARYHHLKQNLNLYSKSRFISFQMNKMLENDLYLESALHANNLAKELADNLPDRLMIPQETNQLFLKLTSEELSIVQDRYHCYEIPHPQWNGKEALRLVTSFRTKREDIDNFLKLFK